MLSVLIPVYNYNVLPLVQALHAQLIQQSIAFEVIVLDDCSTIDYSAQNAQINLLTNCRYLQNEINLGRTLTRNKLAEATAFNTLLFLDADVLPASDAFIAHYIPHIHYNGVVFGGYAYRPADCNSTNYLRYQYGKHREEQTAAQRAENPYAAIFSGNLMLPKNIFFEHNYSGAGNLYGMDIFLAYSLYKKQVAVKHIDNPIYHLGLETNEVFFKKSLEAVKNRKILANEKSATEMNALLRHYKTLKKYGLAPLVAIGFKITAPLLRKMIFKKDPSLFCLDIYRLGYICAIK